MNFPGKWRALFFRRKLSVVVGEDLDCTAAAASGLDDLERRLSQWSDVWTQEDESAARTEAQQLVEERLGRWMDRCFGQHIESSLRRTGSPISMASSTPIFTAFLGRRATRELSRRVLQDI